MKSYTLLILTLLLSVLVESPRLQRMRTTLSR